MSDVITIDFVRRPLDNGFFATQHGNGNWIVYHESNPTQAVWETVELGDARLWSRLPELKKFVESHGFQAAINPQGKLEIYIPWSADTPFGKQNGIEVFTVVNMKEAKEAMGY